MKSLDFRGAWLTPLLTLLGAMVAGMLYAGVALAAPVNEVEPNNSSAAAQNIDGSFTLDQDPDIGDATTNTSTTMPHATVEGTGDDSFDYYSFTVTQAGARGIFDIDYAGVCDSDSFLAGFDAFLTLHDSNGNLPDFNDGAFSDPPVGQGGSVCGFDSYFEHTFATPGTYYIEVSSCCGLPEPHPVPAVGFDGAATSYKLQVSLSGVALAQGGADVCVSNKGETKVQKGDSTCSSDSTSHAVAHNDSEALASDNSQAKANNDSRAVAFDNSQAKATNGSFAGANDNCTAKAQNGEVVECGPAGT